MSQKKRAIKTPLTKKTSVEQKKLHKHQKTFWGTIIAVLIISAVTISLNFESSPTGYFSVQKVSFLKAGKEIYMEVKDADGLKFARFTFKEDVENTKITFEKVETVSWNFEGEAYSMFKGSTSVEDKIATVELTVELKREDLAKKDWKIEDVRVYDDGTELPTTLKKNEEDYLQYVATGNSLGEFVIGKASPSVTTTLETKESTTTKQEPESTAPTTTENTSENKETTLEPIVGEATQEPLPEVPATITEEPVEQQPAPSEEKSIWTSIKEFFYGVFV